MASIQNNKFYKSLKNAIAVRDAHHVEIENSQIEDVGEVAISVSDTNFCLVHDNEISNCSIAAIESYNGSNVIVKSNKIMRIEKNVFIAFTGGQIKAEKNEIKDVKESMVKLAENGGGEFVDNQISNCSKQAEIDQNASLFFLCGNGNFTNETNDESRVNESVMLKKMDKSDNSLCMNCHKNKRDCFFDLCLHKIYCRECAEQLIKDKKGCPLCKC